MAQGNTGEYRELVLPVFAVDHAFDSFAEVENVEIDQQAYRYSA